MGNALYGKNIVYIKIVFKENVFKMAGEQNVFQYNDLNSPEMFRQLIIERINILLERYEYSATSISHIIITFIPVNFNIISSFKVK